MKKILHLISLFVCCSVFGQVVTSTNTGNTTYTTNQVRFFVNMQGQPANAFLRYVVAPGTPIVSAGTVSQTYPSNTIPATQSSGSALVFNMVNLTPGTQYNYVVELLNMNTGVFTTSAQGSFSTLAITAPTVTSVSTNSVGTTGASVTFSINPNGANATSEIRYGLSSTNLNQTSSSVATASSNANPATEHTIGLTSLSPATTYFYSVRSTNSAGVTNSTPVQTFTTVTPQMIYHFPFNGNMTSVTNSVSLTSPVAQTYVSNGTTANNALSVVIADNNDSTTGRGTTPSATLNLLPTGNSPRTIAMRVKFNSLSATNYPISYGSPSNGQAFGFEQNSTTTKVSGWGTPANGFSRDYTFSPVVNTWYTYVITYDGANTILYIDNTAFASGPITLNTIGQNLVLGRSAAATFGTANCAIDDLKIYNYSLSAAEVAALNGAQLPTISNVTNSLITTNKFNVNFNVTANGSAGSAQLRWGTSPSALTNTLAGQSFVASATNVANTIILPSTLSPGTTYYYAVDATNSVGTTTITGSCTTALPPSAPSIGAVSISNITTNGASISYQVNPNNAATDAYVLYGTSASALDSNLNYNSGITTTTTLNENFTGLDPATQYFYRIVATNGSGTTQSVIGNFTTLTPSPTIGTPTVVTSIDRADISFPLTTNAASASYVVNYGTNASNLNLSATGTTLTASSTILVRLAGLAENTTYYYRISATNTGGTTTVPSTGTNSFVTLTKTLLYHFPFNGSLTSADNSVTLDASSAVTYVSNGGSNTNEAALLNMSVTKDLPNLPQGNRARTITLRLKFNDFVEKQHLFNYGSNADGQKFLLAQNATTTFYEFFGGAFDTSYANAVNTTNWYNYAVTFDMNEVKIYRDGVLLNPTQTLRTLNTIGTFFRMRVSGIAFENYLNINADDLRIYNYALTQSEITALNASLTPATPAPAITNVSTSNVTFNSATVNFNLNAFGSATTYEVEYSTDSIGNFWTLVPGGTTSANTSTPFTVQISGLDSSEQYFVRVKATNATNQVTTSNVVSFTTLNPIVVTNLGNSNITATTAQINYTLNTNGINASVQIAYQASAIFDFDLPFTTVEVSNFGINTTTATNYNYTLTGLTPNTLYSYQFVAFTNNGGNFSGGQDSAFTTLGVSAQPTAPSPQTFCQSSNPTVANLSATGTNIKWYAAATGGSALPSTTVLAQGTYYVTQTQANSAESNRVAVTVNINITSAPSNVPANQVFCQSATLGNIQTGAGSNFKWYAAQSVGTELPTSTAISTGTYYLSQTIGSCESARTPVSVTVNVVNAPTAQAQTFCQSGTVANLVANGTQLKWYAAQTGGTQLASTTALATGTYYVSQTNANCESTRTAVSVTVNVVNAPSAQAQSFCQSATVADLVANGAGIKWYAAQTGGTQLAPTTALTTATYFVSQTVNNCESSRTAVTVQVTQVQAPIFPQNQSFCSGATLANIQVSFGTNLKWFANATGGNQLANTTVLTTGTYYASQTVVGCESSRTAVSVIVNVVNAPTGSATQTFVQGATIANLVANGSSIVWFASQADALNNVNPLAASSVLVNNTTYYAMQTVSNCRSTSPLAVTVTVTLSNNEVNKLSFSMYPNPASEMITIEMDSEVKTVEIYSIHGQKVQTSNTKSVVLNNLAAGIYFVKVEDVDGLNSTKKLIIK